MNKFELLKRIKKIILEKDIPITKISHIDVSDQLQAAYRDYSRKTQSSFRKSVFEAIQKLASEINEGLIINQEDKRMSLDNNNSNINGSLNQILLERYKKEGTPLNVDKTLDNDFFIDKNGNTNILHKKRKDHSEHNKKIFKPKKIKLEDESLIPKPKLKLFSVIPPSEISFTDLEGTEIVVKELEENFLKWIRLDSNCLTPRGLILHGPAGCGKFSFTKALASNLNMNLINISADELLPNLSLETDKKLKYLLEQSITEQPCLIVIKKIELIASLKEDFQTNSNDTKILAQFLQFMEAITNKFLKVWIIGITSKIESLNPILLMPGRLDEEIVIKMPDQSVRIKILKKFCNIYENLVNKKRNNSTESELEFEAEKTEIVIKECMELIKLDNNLDFNELSQSTPAYSGADLKKLVIKAFRHSILRQQDTPIKEICLQDFLDVLKKMQPTAKREDYVTIPNVTWKDVGALDKIREELKISILIPVRQPDLVKRLGLNHPSGVLLFGPPGCGKTMIAKAFANEASINFISVKGPELLNMYVGESERNIRTLFRRAQDCSPCIVFFDEIDSICEKRSTNSDKGNNVKVVQQLLAELDGLQERRDLYIMGATNRLDRVDPAFLRENRFNKILYVGLPNSHERFEILQTITKNGASPNLDFDVSLKAIAEDERCSKFTGADLTSLVRTAARFLLKDLLSSSNTDKTSNISNELFSNTINDLKLKVNLENKILPGISTRHFEMALQKVKPSIRQKDLEYYVNIAKEYELEN